MRAVKATAAGGKVLDRPWPQSAGADGHRRPQSAREQVEPLSEREIAVLRLAGQGLTNKAIGLTLNISDRTAGHHEYLRDKLAVSCARKPSRKRSSWVGSCSMKPPAVRPRRAAQLRHPAVARPAPVSALDDSAAGRRVDHPLFCQHHAAPRSDDAAGGGSQQRPGVGGCQPAGSRDRGRSASLAAAAGGDLTGEANLEDLAGRLADTGFGGLALLDAQGQVIAVSQVAQAWARSQARAMLAAHGLCRAAAT